MRVYGQGMPAAICAGLGLLFLFAANPSWGAEGQPDFRRMVEESVPDELPEIGTLITGYARPATEPPTLTVANLDQGEGLEEDWRWAVSQMLRWNFKYCVRDSLRVPDLAGVNFRSDMGEGKVGGADIAVSTESLLYNHRWLGIENVLRGGFKIGDTTFEIHLALCSFPDFATQEVFEYSGELADCWPSLNEVVSRTYEILGKPLTEEGKQYLIARLPKSFEDFRAFVKVMNKFWFESTEGWKGALHEQAEKSYVHPFACITAVSMLADEKDLTPEKYTEEMKRLFAYFPDDPGAPLMAARYCPEKDNDASLKIESLLAAIPGAPNDPMGLIFLGTELIEAQRFSEGAVPYLEIVERWPDYYRGWWGLTFSLYKYGWSLRGNDYWEEVSQKGKVGFSSLMSLAEYSARTGLSLREDSANLWYYRMVIIGSVAGAEPAFFQMFDKAVEYCPSCDWVYRDAMNYVRPQWGGTLENEQYIVDTAIKHTPIGSWPREMSLTATRNRLYQYESQKDWFNPKELARIASESLRSASMVAADEDLYRHVYNVLGLYLRAGQYEEGTAYLKRAKHHFETEEPSEGMNRQFLLFLLAQYALSFDQPDLALSLLEEYEEDDQLGEFNYRVPVLKSVARILKSPTDANLEALVKVVRDQRDNIYGMNRILELGLQFEFDREIYDQCAATLSSWNPDSVEELPRNTYEYARLESESLEKLKALFNNLAKAHREAKKGNSENALWLYREAYENQIDDEAFVDYRDPLVLAPMYRLIRKTHPQS